MPDKHKGFSDIELRSRQRYVDLFVNESSRDVFRRRSQVVSHIRRFFEDRQFMEVETPMMQVIPGGAAARPFVTHHNALDMELYLRIAPELFLKRLSLVALSVFLKLIVTFVTKGFLRSTIQSLRCLSSTKPMQLGMI